MSQLVQVASYSWQKDDGGSMCRHLFTNYNSSHDELWYLLCQNVQQETYSKLKYHLKLLYIRKKKKNQIKFEFSKFYNNPRGCQEGTLSQVTNKKQTSFTFSFLLLSERLDSAFSLNPASHVFLFSSFPFFFCFHMFKRAKFTVHETNFTVHALFRHCSRTVHHCSSTVYILKNIKNGSYGTIHTFKNYFATVFLVFSFSNNKFNPNGP